MTLTELVILLLISGVCGAVGQGIAGYSRGGCLASIALGFIGALLGGYLAHRLGLPEILEVKIDQVHFPIVWSIVGATLFVAVISLLTRRSSL
jgi:uncharacterized membrane protein YeaQ/YmgE (transglycosylase-associated protein family)